MNYNTFPAEATKRERYARFHSLVQENTNEPLVLNFEKPKTPFEFLGDIALAGVLGHVGVAPLLGESATSAVLAGDVVPYGMALSGEVAAVAYAQIQSGKSLTRV